MSIQSARQRQRSRFQGFDKKSQGHPLLFALGVFRGTLSLQRAFLKKMNPKVNFAQPVTGTVMKVPNVVPFEIEELLQSRRREGNLEQSEVGKSKVERMVYISADDMMLTVWEGAKLIRSYPITLNESDSPRGKREIGTISPGPHYMRKKTGLELKPGPNSPVGIVWCPLGNGFGIHGTNNPATIGRATSSGCVRLANWDAVRFAELVKKNTTVMVSERERAHTPN